ncbi:MAG: glycosyltransferase family 39 protein [Anaerolineales bacterium]
MLILLSFVVHAPVLYLVEENPNRATPPGDSQQYQALAQNLLDHHVFSLEGSPPFMTDVLRTPGYPLLLAALYVLGGHSVLVVALAQAGLRTLGAFLLVGIAERVIESRAVGWIAAILWLLAPLPTVLTGILFTETLFTTLLLLTLWFLTGEPSWRNALLAGLFFGFALITRPIAELLIPWVVLMLLLHKPLRSVLIKILPLALGVAIATGPWLAYTAAQFRTPILSTIGADNLAFYTSASVLAHEQGMGFSEASDRVHALYQQGLAQFQATHPAPASPSEEAAIKSQIAYRILLAHPLQSAWFNLVDSFNTLRPGVTYTVLFLIPGSLPSLVSEGSDFSPATAALGEPLVLGVTLALLLFYAPLYAASTLSLLLLFWKKRWQAVAAVVLPSAILFYAPGLPGNGRFRVPFEPLLCLLASAMILKVIEAVRSRKGGRSSPQQRVHAASSPGKGGEAA